MSPSFSYFFVSNDAKALKLHLYMGCFPKEAGISKITYAQVTKSYSYIIRISI